MADNLYAICEPRSDVLQGALKESDFAADLSQVLRGDAPEEYREPELFFANTYPTKGLKNALKLVALRVLGRPEQVGAVFRLDTQFGGGKTHTLIGLAHAMRSLVGVPNADEFLEPALRPATPIRIAAFDGENADPANGRRLSDSIRAFCPWGELAFALAGEPGYRLVEQSDKEGIAPGADTLRELLGTEPALILIDEIAPYLRKVAGRNAQRAGEQLLAFMTSLMKAVESLPKVALVFTLAVGRDGKATDAYSRETQDIAAFFAEAESIAARKATVIDPTEDDETVKVVCRRLFTRVDEAKARQVVAAYKALWDANRDKLPTPPAQDRRVEEFEAGYPLHP
jgi:predicted AAA+ superfamily ATPase